MSYTVIFKTRKLIQGHGILSFFKPAVRESLMYFSIASLSSRDKLYCLLEGNGAQSKNSRARHRDDEVAMRGPDPF